MFKPKSLFLLMASLLTLSGCGGTTDGETVRLQVWGPAKEGEKEVYEYLAGKFQEAHPEITFKMGFGDVGEGDAATMALGDIDTAADVFMFADDQLANLVQKGVLNALPTTYANIVRGRDLARSVSDASFTKQTEEEKVYAFPLASDNGYMLVYNKAFFNATDVLTLEGMMAKADANHQVVIDMGNGYYSMTGLLDYGQLSYDPFARVHTTDFDSVANASALQGLINIIQPKKDKGFKSVNVDDVMADFSNANGNKVVAAVTGNWNVDNIKELLGADFAAAKLPTYTSTDSSVVQMGSFTGSKLVGVKSSSLVSAWALSFAEFVTNEAAQLYRFEQIAKGPTNSAVYNSPAVLAEPGLAALDAQYPFAISQGKSVGDTFWTPAGSVGNFIVNGPAGVDGPQTIQEQLTAFVQAITAAPEVS